MLASLFLVLVSALYCSSGPIHNSTVTRIGNEIQASLSGVDARGAMFLQTNIVLTEGVVFAYSAYFRNNKRVRFQIWRPVHHVNESSAYRLLAETTVTPSVVLSREDIYIESRLTDRCIRVKEGDHLGILFEEAPGSIAYVLDDESPTALGNRVTDPDQSYNMGDVMSFDALRYPYDFSVAAYVDTDPTHYVATDPNLDFVNCFPHVQIPDYENVTQFLAGATGATGPMGATGLQGPAGLDGAWGATGEIGATGALGATGPIGTMGATGETGAQGEKGEQGERGEAGQRGEVGPAGPPGEVIYVNNAAGSANAGDNFFSSKEMSLFYLIWLIVLTIAVIVLVIITCILAKRTKNQREMDETMMTNSEKFPGFDTIIKSNGDWKEVLKDESSTLYSTDTHKSTPQLDTLSVPTLDNMETSSGCWRDYLKAETETIYSNATLQRDPNRRNYEEGNSPMTSTELIY